MTALQRFSPEVSDHFLGRTPMQADFFHVHLISNEKVSNVDMPCAFAAQGPLVLFQEDEAPIVLQQ
jgi:hypothetical protein